VFEAILQHEPDLFVQLGDIHYSGVNRLSQKEFEFGYYEVFSKNKVQSNFYKHISLAHVFDDHDFGSNNADSSAASNPRANAAYRSMVKILPQQSGVYHAFATNNVKFIVLDGRTFKSQT
jgi:phosphodiesterase/alkaline phosphatase D-like protein